MCVSSSLLLLEKVVKVVHVAVCSSCRRTCKRSRDGLPGNNNHISRTCRFGPRYTTTPMRNHRRTSKSCFPVETLRQLRPNVRDDYTPRSDNATDSNRTPMTLHFMPPSSTVASKVPCTICRPTSVTRKVGVRVIRPSTLTTLLRLRSGTTNPIGHGTEDQALARACPQAQANLCVSEGFRHQRSRGLCWPWALYPRSYGSV